MVSKKLLGSVIAVIIVVAAVGVYWQFIMKPAEPPTPESKITVQFSWPTEPDPAIGNDWSSNWAMCALYDPLFWPGEGGTTKGMVAKSYDVSDEGRVWTININEGIEFHSGNELTAEDVYFSMKRLLDIGRGFAFMFSEINMTESEVVDDDTVKFVLDKPSGVLHAKMTKFFIVDKDTVLDHTEAGDFGEYGDYGKAWLKEHDAGSGPYQAVEVKREQSIKMSKFDDYWQGLPENAAETLIYEAMPKISTIVTQLQKRELEISAVGLPASTLRTADDIEGVEIAETAPIMLYWGLHTRKTPTDDIYVRKALAYAMDYEEYANAIYHGEVAHSTVHPFLLGYKNLTEAGILPDRDKNISMAQKMLEKSKYYPDIVDNPEDYTITIDWCSFIPYEEDGALILKQCAEEAGLDVEVVSTPWSQMMDECANQEEAPHAQIILCTARYGEAIGKLQEEYHSSSAETVFNNAWLYNDTIDTMIEDALETVDKEDRITQTKELQRIIMRMQPAQCAALKPTTHAYQASYVKWPQAEGDIPLTNMLGYDLDPRVLEVFPEEKQAQTASMSAHGSNEALSWMSQVLNQVFATTMNNIRRLLV